MKKEYPSRIDFWFYLVAVLPLVSLYPALKSGDLLADGILALLTIFLLSLMRTIYTIDDTKLRIKCGFFHYSAMEVTEIVSIRRTRTILSSPALSLDRIAITSSKGRQLVISPRERIDFIRQLLALNPDIKVDENLLLDY